MSENNQERRHFGRSQPEVILPTPIPTLELPDGYARFLENLKARISRERLKAVLSANTAMILMYWDFGKEILQRQKQEGWGAKVIDRLSYDLRQAFPQMHGFSPPESQIHAEIRLRLARSGNSATHRCTIILAQQHHPFGSA